MKFADLDRGDVVLVAFPFTDLTATKVRPAVVLSKPELLRRYRDVVLAAVSSVVPREIPPTSLLVEQGTPEFASSGLRVTSVVHCGKIATVQGTLVLKRLGRLGSPAARRLDAVLRRAVGLG